MAAMNYSCLVAPDEPASKARSRKEGLDLRKDFENVKRQVGYCGIWCGSCVVGNGALRETTIRYERMVKDHGIGEWGPREVDYDVFFRGLTSIGSIPTCSGCRKGGGRTDCEIRACAVEKGIDECSQCGETSTCRNLKLLRYMREGAEKAGLMVTSGGGDRGRLIEIWTDDLCRRWPFFVLFLDESEGAK
ncbi:MAG: DUF3795 domain-containing protein [Euryarchaeota archaeon]|nr:DUF3795 domain-containing protein [Euryarchaeota archaeon]